VTKERPAAARLSGIRKAFGAVAAVDGADLLVHAGEVHGVLGENGAGKTTLLSILGGSLRPDAGEIRIGNAAVDLRSPRHAWDRGVGMVHQHFTLVPRLTVLENLTLGFRDAARGWRLPLDDVRVRAEELMGRTGLSVPFDSLTENLDVGERQRIEILKALLRNPSILILDEPTAVLMPGEIERLFALVRDLTDRGVAVVLVAHKLDEVLSVSDRVTVMREGRSILTAPVAEVERRALTRAMVGREPEPFSRPPAPSHGKTVAELRGARMLGRHGEWALDDVTLSIQAGEILGVAGVQGNGQRELAMALSGVRTPDGGSAMLPSGVGFITQDRSREGLIPDFDLVENMALALHRRAELRRGLLLDWRGIRDRTAAAVTRYQVRTPGASTAARALSGGNQQRLVVAREVAEATDLLVAENPTRGLDVAAAAFVHEELKRLVRGDGDTGMAAVVLISTDLDEVLALSHRIVVLVRGRILAVPEQARTKEGLGSLMLSVDHATA
jgi:simple sugar transport system ATP-binding protein